ncbi:DUF355-domain-containing protein [Anaeromyces robustus]|uniref:DUF355-domain-containing protein n=1 Tax=Anaeromyces robustus TaxID=1754192 RepID=A0A1Y1WUS6_9FUNG|nr:DUF355-domain-containing protein [Anaeromyces robustus]|eukprot:ORX76956.1 DUF355-domain-containing protein [Anaeromyces robustus]
MVKIETVTVENPGELNLILGQSHFIKTVEDLYEILIQSSMSIKFGLAFCEASGVRLIRFDGNDQELIDLAVKNAKNIGCGHSFIIFMKDAFPINVLNAVKNCSEVCRIYCATANPLDVVVAVNDSGNRGIMGVIDGATPLGVETEKDQEDRKKFLQTIGYKR